MARTSVQQEPIALSAGSPASTPYPIVPVGAQQRRNTDTLSTGCHSAKVRMCHKEGILWTWLRISPVTCGDAPSSLWWSMIRTTADGSSSDVCLGWYVQITDMC